MKLTAVLTAVVATAAIMATNAGASRPHVKWHDMTLTQKRAVVQHEIHVHRSAVRWWLGHRQRYIASSAVPFVKCAALGAPAPGVICKHGQRLVHALHVREQIDLRIAALEAARVAAEHPAHYALWMCIHGDPVYRHAPGGEGSWDNEDTGGTGHYGGLQMTIGWDHRVGNAALLSPLAQMQAAEAGYAASGYSRAWLQGQWGQTIGPCWGYA